MADKTVRMWDKRDGSCIAVLKGHSGEVTSVQLDEQADNVVSGSGDGTIRFVNRSPFLLMARLTHEKGAGTSAPGSVGTCGIPSILPVRRGATCTGCGVLTSPNTTFSPSLKINPSGYGCVLPRKISAFKCLNKSMPACRTSLQGPAFVFWLATRATRAQCSRLWLAKTASPPVGRTLILSCGSLMHCQPCSNNGSKQ